MEDSQKQFIHRVALKALKGKTEKEIRDISDKVVLRIENGNEIYNLEKYIVSLHTACVAEKIEVRVSSNKKDKKDFSEMFYRPEMYKPDFEAKKRHEESLKKGDLSNKLKELKQTIT